MSLARRLLPLSGLAAIACVVAGLGMDAAPTSSWSDVRIVDWYATHSLGHWFVSAYVLAFGAPLMILFTATVHARMGDAGVGRLARGVTLGAGMMFAVTILVGAGLYAAVPAGMTFSKAPAPSADVSRYLLGASYGVLVMFSALAASVLAASMSIVSLSNRLLPRPLAYLGLPAAALMLLNAVMPMAVITLWFVAASIALTVRARRLAMPAASFATVAA